jgi:hypothetical protein
MVRRRTAPLVPQCFTSSPAPYSAPVFGTSAVHYGTGRVFVGVGGYAGIGDKQVTPSLRLLNKKILNDEWPTAVQTVGANKVATYNRASPTL